MFIERLETCPISSWNFGFEMPAAFLDSGAWTEGARGWGRSCQTAPLRIAISFSIGARGVDILQP